MTAEERLNRVRNGRAEYLRLIDRVNELEAIAEKTTATLTGMPRGGDHQADDTWAALIDYRDRLTHSLKQYMKDCEELEEELNCILSPSIRTAMLFRYINGSTVEEIAEQMNYSVRQVYNLLGTGRRIYARCYDDN